MQRLAGKHAVVSGAASGIGWATASAFLQSGASVVLLDTDPERCRQKLSALNAEQQRRASVLAVDVSDSVSVDEMKVVLGDNAIDILVNCAAAQTPALNIVDLPVDEWRRAFDVNVTGVFLLSRALIPLMPRGASIINIASQLGSVGLAGFSAYCATKGAILQLTRVMALDHAADGIRVNSISPGATLTERLRTRFGSDQAATDAMVAGYPLGRLGRPEEIVPGIVYLASDDASFTTGSDLVIDGGYLAR